MPSTLVLLEGNHSTVVRGTTVSEVEDVITLARRNQREITSSHEFVYLQPHTEDETVDVNRVAVDPFAVVGIVAVD